MDKDLVTRLLATTASIAWLAVNAPAQAQSPQSPTVAAGSIAITRQGATTVVNQTTDRGIIDWRSFSIGAGEAVRFDQPGRSSVTLNRVTGSELSRIDGNLSANGQVWLANPNGVLIGNSGQVNVGGLLATTGRIDAAEFLKSGRAAIDQIGKDSGIANLGTVNIAEGGYAALAAASIRNEGVVAARKGSVALGAGKAVTVDFTGDKLITFQVTKPLDQAVSGDSMISVGGKIAAEGGTVLISARAAKGVMDNVVNLRGHVVANSVTVDGGTVSFGDGGIVQVSGRIDASNLAGKGGEVAILGEKVGLMEGASIDASGGFGGGTVLVGGDWQGKGPNHNATIAYVAPTASINVDATMAGDAGKAVVWADDTTRFDGSINARGGLLFGNGGQVETSGKRALNIGDTAAVNTGARAGAGKPGTWLLDPNDITIDPYIDYNITKSSPFQAAAGGASIVKPSTLSAALLVGDVTVQTSGGFGGNGDIIFSSGAITSKVGTARTLTLLADRDIVIKNGATIALTGAAHNVVLRASANAGVQSAVTGGIQIQGGTITTTGGAITLSAGLSGNLAASGSSALDGRGIYILDNSVIDAGSGTFLGRGLGRTGVSAPYMQGFELSNYSTITANGGVTMIGTGGATSTDQSRGVQLLNNAVINISGGTLSIQGTGGAAPGQISRGVQIDGSKINAGGAKVSIAGTAAASNSTDTNYGVYLASSTISGSGDVSITGVGGGAAGSANHGIMIENASLVFTGAATITLDGARGGGVGANVQISSSALSTTNGAITISGLSTVGNGVGVGVFNAGGSISTVDGAITIFARGGASAGNGFSSDGKSPVKATGTGSVTIEASASASGASGIQASSFSGFVAVAQTNSGDLTLRTDKFAWGGVFGGALSSTSGTVKLQSLDAGKSIGLGSVAGGDLNVFESFVSTINGKIEVGRPDLTAGIIVNSSPLPKSVRLLSKSGDVTFVSDLNAADKSIALAVDTGGLTTVNGWIGQTTAFASLDISGAVKFANTIIRTFGAQSYGGAVAITAASPTTFSTNNANVTFSSTLDGPSAFDGKIGSGVLTLSGAVGGATALGGFSATGPLTLAAGLTTTGDQSYGGVVSLTGVNTLLSSTKGSITVGTGSTFSYTNAGAGSLGLLAATDVLVSGGAIKSATAALNVTLNSGATGATQAAVGGGIKISGGTIVTKGGAVNLVGGASGAYAAMGTSALDGRGVVIDSSSVIDAGAGAFTARGRARDGFVGNYVHGIEVNTGNTITANGGVIMIGEGGDAGFFEWRGVNLLLSTINVSGGNTVISGTGGATKGSGAIQAGVGVMIRGMTMNLGAGSVGISGTAGSFGTATENVGVLLRDAAAITGSGAMTIVGVGGGVGAATLSHGVSVKGSSVTLSGKGSLTVTGTRGVGGTSHNIAMDNKAAFSSAGGSIDLLGSASSGGGAAGFGDGVNMQGSVTSVDGAITVNGVGALLGASNNGVTMTGTLQATGAGSILIKGGAGLLGSEYTQTAGLVATKSGDLTLQANSTAVSGAAALTTVSGTIRIQPYTSPESILVGPGLYKALSGAVEIGKSDMAGSISVLAGVTLNNNASFVTKSGIISFLGALDAKAAGQTLKIDSGSAFTSFAGSVGATVAFNSLDVSGALTTSAADIRTTGTQSYGGGVSIASGVTTSFSTTNSALTFGSTVNGPGSFNAKTGTGVLSFGGAVGATTALGGFSASGALTLGAGLTTTGAQSYGGVVTLAALNTVLSSTASSITLGSGSLFSYTNASAGSLSLLAGTDIKIASGAIKSSTAVLNVTLNAGATGVDQATVGGGIDVNAGTIETKGGSLSMVGGSGGAYAAMGSAGIGGRGIYVIGASKFDLGAGSFTAKGVGRNGVAGTYVEGVVLFGGTTVTANGGVTVEGASGDGATIEGRGVRINTATINSTGAVSITGKGGGSTVVSRGVDLLDSKLAFGAGAVTITGFGGTNSAQSKNYGVMVSGTTALTGSGAITINGTGGGKAGVTGNDHGVYMQTATIAASGPAAVSITGARGAGDASRNIWIDAGATVQTDGGALTLKGDATTGGAGTNNQGVQIVGKLTTATGAISLSGAGAFAGAGDGLDISGTVQATGTGGSILLRGAGAGAWSDLVQFGGAISTTSGDVTIQGNFFNVIGAPSVSSGTGTVRLQSLSAADLIDVGVAPGAKGLTTALLSTIKGAIEIGSTAQTGAISVAANTVLNNATTITSGSGAVNFLGAVDGAQTLKINAAGAKTSFAGAVGGATAFASLDVLGPVSFADVTVKTVGTQSYGGAAALSGAGTTSFSTKDAAVTFGATLDGPSALDANTGSGALKFVGAIGGSTVLGGFSTSGALTLGAGLTTTGAQSYGGVVTLTGTNVLLSSTKSSITVGTGSVLSYTNGAAGSLSLLAGTDITIASGTIASATAALNVTLNSGSTGFDQPSVGGGIVLNAGTITTNGGALSMVGGVGGAFAAMGGAGIGGRGINVTGATKIDLGAGALTAKGVGRNGVAGAYVEGVALAGATITANGGVTLEGKSGDGATLTGNRGVGVSNTTLNVATGNVAITGDGGGAKVWTYGVFLGTGSTLNLGSGTTTITGFGATSSAQDSNHGVMLAGAALTTSGALTITGTGGATGVGASKASAGVLMNGGSVTGTGTGTVTVNGQRGLGADSVNIQILGGSITTASGALTLNGASSSGGANSSGLAFSSVGVQVDTPATVKTVDGLLTVSGTGAASDGKGADGVRIAGKIQATGTGSISITGARGGVTAVGAPTGNDNVEIKAGGLVSTNSGAITVTATASGGSGASDVGFRNAGTVTSTGGNLSITGVGALSGTTAHGVENSGTISTAGSGVITIAGAPGASGVAINTLVLSKITTAGGQLTLKGKNYSGGGQLIATGGVIARQAYSPTDSLDVSGVAGGELGFMTTASVVVGETGMTGDINIAAGGVLKSNTTFITQSGAINFSGALNAETAGVQTLKIQTATGTTSFGGSIGGTKAFSTIDATGSLISSAAVVQTTGTQSYGGAVQIAAIATTTFSTKDSAVTFGSTVEGPGSFDAKTGFGALKFSGTLGGTTALAAFSAAGPFTLGAGLTTVGDQSYGGVVTLTGTKSTLSSTAGAIKIGTGGVLSYTNALAGSLSLLAKTDILIDGGAIKSAGAALNLTLNSGADAATQAAVDGGVLVKNATITTTGGSVSIVGGQNGALAAMGGVAFPDFGLSVRNGVMLTGASQIDAGSGAILVRGAARDSGFFYGHGVEVNNATSLTGLGGVTMIGQGSGTATAEANGVNLIAGAKLDGGGGGVTLIGSGGGVASLVSGVVVNNSIVQASGSGVVTVTGIKGAGSGAGLSMSAGALSTAGGALTIKAAEQAVSGASKIDAGAGTVSLQSSAPTTSLNVSAGILSFVNASALTVGESGQAAAINIAAGATVKQNVSVLSGAGTINFLGAFDANTAGGQSLKIQSGGGLTSFGGSLGAGKAFAKIDVSGPVASSAAVIQTTGTQSYGGAVQIATGVTTKFSTSDSAVTFGSSLEGPGGFDAKTGSGALQFTGSLGGTTALGAFSTAGPLTLNGGLTTVGDQSYGGVVTLTGTNSVLKSTDGAIKVGTGGVLSYANATAGSLSLLAKADIVIDGGAIKSTSGALTLTLNSGAYATTQADVKGGVLINAGAITTAGGSLLIAGGAGGTLAASGSDVLPDLGASARNGVMLYGGTVIDLGSGAFTARGQAITNLSYGHGIGVANSKVTALGGVDFSGTGSDSASLQGFGVRIQDMSVVNGGAGGLKINGKGGALGAGAAIGVAVFDSTLSAAAGGLTLTGAGGASAADASGVALTNTFLAASGTGAVTVTGIKGAGPGFGLAMTAGSLSTAGGALSIKAAEQSVTGASKIDAGGGTVALQSSATTTALTVSKEVLSFVNAAALTIGESGQAAAINIAAGATVKQNLTVLSGAGDVNFLGAIDANVAGGQTLKIQTVSGSTNFAGSVGATKAFNTLDVSGSMTSKAADIKTTGTQSYAGAVQIASGVTTIFTTKDSAVSFGGVLNGPGGLGFNAGTATVSLTGGVGTSTVLSGLSVDRAALGGGINTVGPQSYGAVTLLADTAISAGGSYSITFGGAVSGAHDLSIFSDVAFKAGAGTLKSLNQVVGNVAILGGDITTSFDQFYNGAVKLTTDVTLSSKSGSITLGSANSAATPAALTVNASSSVIYNAGATTSLASLTVLGGGTASLGGTFKTTGTQSYSGAVSLADDATFSTTGAAVNFSGAIQSTTGKSMTVLAGTGAVTLAAGAGLGGSPLGGVNIDAPLSVSGGVTTTGSQSYGGAITLTGKSAFSATGQTIAFKGDVSGAYDLSVNAASIQLGGAAPITVQTTGLANQSYAGAIVLLNDATLDAANKLTLSATIDGAKALTVKGADVSIGAKIGDSTPLASLTATTKAGPIFIGADIITAGAQSYFGVVGLSNDVLLKSNGADVALSGAVVYSGAPKSLAITVNDPAGKISLGGVIGSAGAMKNVTLSTNGTDVLLPSINAANLAVTTKGTVSQAVGSSLNLSGNAFIDANAGITLTNSGNDFSQIALTTAGAATMADANGFVLSNSTVAGALSLNAGGAVTQSGALSTSGLLLQGSGASFSMDDSANAISTLAANVAGGTISVVNGAGASLSVGAVSGVSGVTGASSLSIDQKGAANTLTLAAPVALGTGAGSLSADGVITGVAKITGSKGSTLKLAVGGTGSAITGDADIKYTVTAGTISINGALFTPSGAVPVITPTVATVPTVASVATLPTTISVASQPTQAPQATVASTPSVPSSPTVPKVVVVETTPTLIGNEKVEDVVSKLIVSLEVSLPNVNKTLSATLQDQDSRTVVPLQTQSLNQNSSPSNASSARSGADVTTLEYTAQRMISTVNGAAIGALIAPSPPVVRATGAPLAAANTIKVDPADTGGANGQVIARGGAEGAAGGGFIGVASQERGTTTILPGLLVQSPRPTPPRGEPPLAEQPSTINEEVFLD